MRNREQELKGEEIIEICSETIKRHLQRQNMRNREEELDREEIVGICMENVKKHFADIDHSIEFGLYILPEDYFVSYIFRTNAQLKAAQQNGLTEKINSYHREQLKKHHYPICGIKDCDFASQEECDKEYDGNWYHYYK